MVCWMMYVEALFSVNREPLGFVPEEKGGEAAGNLVIYDQDRDTATHCGGGGGLSRWAKDRRPRGDSRRFHELDGGDNRRYHRLRYGRRQAGFRYVYHYNLPKGLVS